MEQSGGFAHDLCVVGLSEHFPEYPLYFKEQENHVVSMILYIMSQKKIKHYGETPELDLLIFQVNWVGRGNFGGMIILPAKITSSRFE
jgi:hypothetical protein